LTLVCPSFLLQKWGGDPESKDNRLSGSQTLFLHIKQTVKNVSRLSKDTLFFQTFEEISRGLLAYANLLESKIPKKPDTSHLTPRASSLPCVLVFSAAHLSLVYLVRRGDPGGVPDCEHGRVLQRDHAAPRRVAQKGD
jgi:hypothetical protein